MDPLEALKEEHRLIERVLDVAESYGHRLPRETEEDRPKLSELLEFFSEFADACHHEKEEKILFTAMVENGFPSGGGPIAVMLQEHDLGRSRIRALRQLAALEGRWTAEDRRQVAGHIAAYAELLRGHIIKEDTILYPMAQAHLPEEALQEIGERFEEVESRDAGKHARLTRLAASLAGQGLPCAAHGTGGPSNPRGH